MRATSKGRAEDRPDDSMQSDAAESRWGSGGGGVGEGGCTCLGGTAGRLGLAMSGTVNPPSPL